VVLLTEGLLAVTIIIFKEYWDILFKVKDNGGRERLKKVILVAE
jgi:hypothetical protein